MLNQARTLSLLLLFTACGGGSQTGAAHGPSGTIDAANPRAADGQDGADTPAHTQPESIQLPPPLRFVPTLDANAELMGRLDIDAVQEATFSRPGYFTEAVPRRIHRVLQPEERPGAWAEHAQWRAYSDAMGFELVEWDPMAAAATGPQATSVRAQAFVAALAAGRTDVAVALSGLAVLAKHGGFLIGPQVLPPTALGCSFDLQDMGARQGLTLTTNLRARNVGGWSVYVTTALMAASPQHPWVVAASTGAALNTLALLQGPHAHLPQRYFAGNAYLSRNVAGIFSIVPFTYLHDLGMFGDLEDVMSEEDALE